ncbi:glycosyltransferase [Sorangium sp. So ce375]|uniref:glycosyltransferase n=1 Tax=Sorangium sp. So ce375 TaxID=3133306 RepID=UPI003F5B366A
MRICAVVKYPPIQGGVSAQSFWLTRGLADAGHDVSVVTNAESVEDDYRMLMTPEDRRWLDYASPSGGRVRCYGVELNSVRYMHVPQSNPYVSKLASVATDVVRRNGCQLLFAYYLEPYGVAAHLASSWTGVPYVLRHAGSDQGRLMNQPDLATTYREVLRRADGVCTNAGLHFLGLDVPPLSLYRSPAFYLPRQCFAPDVEPLDLNEYIAELGRERPGAVSNARSLDPALPTIGIYGKMGWPKGSFDLVAALGRLAREGLRFNFVAVTRGSGMDEYRRAIAEHGIGEMTWVLPFVPHWRIARFIRSCAAVCFLERDFPIRGHAPTIPVEVLACGTCMIVSGEILSKQAYRDQLVPGDNFLLVRDPKDHAELASVVRRVIEAPREAAEIGRRGAQVDVGGLDHRAVVKQYEEIFTDVLGRRRGLPSAVSLRDRNLPATRADVIAEAAGTLKRALGDEAEVMVRDYLEASPEPPDNLLDDALAFCRHVRARTLAPPARPALHDAARFVELLVGQARLTEEELSMGPFEGIDRVMPVIGPENDVMLDFAPSRSRWLTLARFTSLPQSMLGPGEAAPGREHTVVFHKLPNAHGHHFGVNRWTAELLERCDGSRTTRELVAEFQREAGRPRHEVEPAVIGALRRLHRERLLIFVEPRRAGEPAPPAPSGGPHLGGKA